MGALIAGSRQLPEQPRQIPGIPDPHTEPPLWLRPQQLSCESELLNTTSFLGQWVSVLLPLEETQTSGGLGKEAGGVGAVAKKEKALFGFLRYHRRLIFSGFLEMMLYLYISP